MSDSPLGRLARTLLVGVVVGFMVVAAVAPPDPFSQLRLLAAWTAVLLPVACYLHYGGGYEALAAWLH